MWGGPAGRTLRAMTQEPRTDTPSSSSTPSDHRSWSGSLRRTRGRDAVVAGVAGGLAREIGIDPIFVRLAFVALTIAGGSGVALYLAGWFLIPAEGGHDAIATGFLDRHRMHPWVVFGLAVVGLAIVTDGFWHHGFPIILVVGLLAWAAFHRGGRCRGGHGPAGGGPGSGGHDDRPGWPQWADSDVPAPAAPPAPVGEPGDLGGIGEDAVPGPGAPGLALERSAVDAGTDVDGLGGWQLWPMVEPTTTAVAVEERSKARSLVPFVLLGLLGVAAVDVLLHAVGLVALPPNGVLGIGLVLTGAALVVGIRQERWGGLLALGILLTLAVGAATVAQATLSGGVGTRVVHPTDPAELRHPIKLGAGHLTLDLRDLRPDASVDVRARVGSGKLVVVVADQAGVAIDAHSGVGRVSVLGASHGGLDVEQRVTLPATDGHGTLRLHLSSGFGDVEVRRATTSGSKLGALDQKPEPPADPKPPSDPVPPAGP